MNDSLWELLDFVLMLDFEGYAPKQGQKDAPTPFLAGENHARRPVRQFLLDPRLKPLSTEELPLLAWDEYLDRLPRTLVFGAYTRTEFDQLRTDWRMDGLKYVDFHKALKRFINGNEALRGIFDSLPKSRNDSGSFGREKTWSLRRVAKTFGLEPPPMYGQGKVTKRLNSVLAGLRVLEKSGRPLTATQKSKWTNLLAHNRWDVEAPMQLMRRAVQLDADRAAEAFRSAIMTIEVAQE